MALRFEINVGRLKHDAESRYKAHGCTDVTGFGILGHARNLGAWAGAHRKRKADSTHARLAAADDSQSSTPRAELAARLPPYLTSAVRVLGVLGCVCVHVLTRTRTPTPRSRDAARRRRHRPARACPARAKIGYHPSLTPRIT
jgi:hypothetical protein